MAGCVWVCGLEGRQFTVVELGGGVGGWIRVWIVSEVLVGVGVRGGICGGERCGGLIFTGVVFTG